MILKFLLFSFAVSFLIFVAIAVVSLKSENSIFYVWAIELFDLSAKPGDGAFQYPIGWALAGGLCFIISLGLVGIFFYFRK